MFFHEVLEGKPDAVFGLAGVYKTDARPQKVNLMVGIYHDENLKAELMPTVKKAKLEIFDEDLKAEYLPITGLDPFCDRLGALVFGEKIWEENHGRIFSAQTPGGTGALRVAGEFFSQEVSKKIFISQPTWPNHRNVFEKSGCTVDTYTYYNPEKHEFDFEAMQANLSKMEEKSVVVLHAVCHNPTGCDPTAEEWKEISQLMKERKLIPFFDFAYQGFGENLSKDRESIEIFLNDGHEMVVSYSCSKNFSLYCQRVGAVYIVNENSAIKHRVGSQVKRIIRAIYSNPPAHGAMVVSHILGNQRLKESWIQELSQMRSRLVSARNEFIEMLSAKSKKIDFGYLKKHKGMFSYLDLNKTQVSQIISDFGIYLLDPGRINVAGLTKKNIGYVVESLLKVCES